MNLAFRRDSESLLTIIGGGGGGGRGLAVAWMLCGGLRAWLSARSLLMVVLCSLVARRRFGPQTQ